MFSPSTVFKYLQGQADPQHTVGHNPLGALSVFALLGVLLAQVGSGLISDDEIAFFGPLVAFVSSETVSQATNYHKNIGKFVVLGLVLLHVLAILFHKVVRKESLVLPMVFGDKVIPGGAPAARDNWLTRCTALAVLGLCAAAVYGLASLGQAGSF